MLCNNINKNVLRILRSRNSSVGIVMGYGLDGWDLIPSRSKIFFLLHSIQTGSVDHPASYTMGTGGSFPDGKAARA
jgi:hypothetical protein